MPPGSSQWVTGNVGQHVYNHFSLASKHTIGSDSTVSFSGMFINYGEHLGGAEIILPARELILNGYEHTLQHVAFCLYS